MVPKLIEMDDLNRREELRDLLQEAQAMTKVRVVQAESRMEAESNKQGPKWIDNYKISTSIKVERKRGRKEFK